MNTKSLASGGVCLAVSGFFAISALTKLQVGSATNMGPGYFPLMLAALLMLVGLYIMAKSLTEGAERFPIDLRTLPWRGIILLTLAPILLGFTIRGLGLLPCVFFTSMLSAFASKTQTIRLALLVSVALALFCTLIFGVVLKLPIPIVGPWLS